MNTQSFEDFHIPVKAFIYHIFRGKQSNWLPFHISNTRTFTPSLLSKHAIFTCKTVETYSKDDLRIGGQNTLIISDGCFLLSDSIFRVILTMFIFSTIDLCHLMDTKEAGGTTQALSTEFFLRFHHVSGNTEVSNTCNYLYSPELILSQLLYSPYETGSLELASFPTYFEANRALSSFKNILSRKCSVL